MKTISNKKSKKTLLGLVVAFLLSLSMTIPAYAAEKTILTDRGPMYSGCGGYSSPFENEKGFDYQSYMTNNKTTRLYLSSKTVNYLTGATVHKRSRYGGSGRTLIMDYFYLKGYRNIKLRTYTTHEAIYKNAYAVHLSDIY